MFFQTMPDRGFIQHRFTLYRQYLSRIAYEQNSDRELERSSI
ncbi:hypothetical protein NIES2104_18180 [Leptolyngbya sp. NIES-2104]|nr:hypothetical protein NIES2104_18180 [Leptolyngbya sp. NIES-2104]